MSRIEDFHRPYITNYIHRYQHVDRDSRQWKRLTRSIKTYGNTMMWYDGFNGTDIEDMGINLIDPDDDKDIEKRNKELNQLIGVKVYNHTREIIKN